MASAASRRPSQSAIAEPKCSATWTHERLRGLLGRPEQLVELCRAASTSPSATSAGTRQPIASAWISVLPSTAARSLASVTISRISSSELVPRDQ